MIALKDLLRQQRRGWKYRPQPREENPWMRSVIFLLFLKSF